MDQGVTGASIGPGAGLKILNQKYLFNKLLMKFENIFITKAKQDFPTNNSCNYRSVKFYSADPISLKNEFQNCIEVLQ